jgi:prolyl-tRNA synthetase
MCHGDDAGLRVPPALAHVQAVVLLVRAEDGAGEEAARIQAELVGAGVRARLDDQVATSFGRRATDWELKGVPVRIEVGPRDLKEGLVTLVRRDTGAKEPVPVAGIGAAVADALAAVQSGLLAEATALRDARTVRVDTIEEAEAAAQSGFARIPWATLGEEGEAALAQKAITVRCLQHPDGTVPASLDGDVEALVARAY